MTDASIIRRSSLQELKNAVIRAGDDTAMSLTVKTVISNAYDAAGWDREHRQEAHTSTATAVMMLTAWKVDRGIGSRGEARLAALRHAADLLMEESEEGIRDMREGIDRTLTWFKNLKDAPVATG